jgi:hypothetical protein
MMPANSTEEIDYRRQSFGSWRWAGYAVDYVYPGRDDQLNRFCCKFTGADTDDEKRIRRHRLTHISSFRSTLHQSISVIIQCYCKWLIFARDWKAVMEHSLPLDTKTAGDVMSFKYRLKRLVQLWSIEPWRQCGHTTVGQEPGWLWWWRKSGVSLALGCVKAESSWAETNSSAGFAPSSPLVESSEYIGYSEEIIQTSSWPPGVALGRLSPTDVPNSTSAPSSPV